MRHQRRAKQRVHHDLQHVIEHSGNHILQEAVGLLEARVRICFDQTGLKGALPAVVVSLERHHHKVIANQLKCMLRELHLASDCFIGVSDLLSHLFIQAAFNFFS